MAKNGLNRGQFQTRLVQDARRQMPDSVEAKGPYACRFAQLRHKVRAKKVALSIAS